MSTTTAHNTPRCQACGAPTPAFASVSYGSIEQGYRYLCSACFNREAAATAGLEEFEHIDFEPLHVPDSYGKNHTFHFNTRLCPTGIAIDAVEISRGKPKGYRFQVLGAFSDDLCKLHQSLVAKLRRSLSVRNLNTTDPNAPQIPDHRTVRGLIEWDESNEGVPMLMIDGREVTWDQLGRMLMTFEGWQFYLHIGDISDDL